MGLVGEDHDGHPYISFGVPLHHRLDAHLMFPQAGGDMAQDARLVERLKAQVIGAAPVVLNDMRLLLLGWQMMRLLPCRIDQVAHHRPCRGGAARSLAVEHHVPGSAAVEENRVKGPVHAGQGVLVRHQGGVHPHIHMVPVLFRDGQQLQRIAQILRERDIQRVHLGNALPVDGLIGHPGMEGQGAEDGQLVDSVETFHIAFGVRLRQTQLLGLCQHLFISPAAVRHLSQDVVSCAVHDAHQGVHPVPLKGAGQRPDDGDSGADRRFKIQSGFALCGCGKQLLPTQRHRHLVGGHHGFTLFQGLAKIGQRRLLAPHKLQQQADLRVPQHLLRPGGE